MTTLQPDRSAAYLTAAREYLAHTAHHVASAMRRRIDEHRRERARRRQIRLLGALDDRALKDIGLHRAEIGSLAVEIHGDGEPTRRHAARRDDRAHVSPLD